MNLKLLYESVECLHRYKPCSNIKVLYTDLMHRFPLQIVFETFSLRKVYFKEPTTLSCPLIVSSRGNQIHDYGCH